MNESGKKKDFHCFIFCRMTNCGNNLTHHTKIEVLFFADGVSAYIRN